MGESRKRDDSILSRKPEAIFLILRITDVSLSIPNSSPFTLDASERRLNKSRAHHSAANRFSADFILSRRYIPNGNRPKQLFDSSGGATHQRRIIPGIDKNNFPVAGSSSAINALQNLFVGVLSARY